VLRVHRSIWRSDNAVVFSGRIYSPLLKARGICECVHYLDLVGKVSARRVLVSKKMFLITIKTHSKGFSGKFFSFFAGYSSSNLAALGFPTVNEFIYILTPFVLVLVGLLFLGSICASVLTVWHSLLNYSLTPDSPTLTVMRRIFLGADSLPL